MAFEDVLITTESLLKIIHFFKDISQVVIRLPRGVTIIQPFFEVFDRLSSPALIYQQMANAIEG